jgi:hypothetical protein
VFVRQSLVDWSWRARSNSGPRWDIASSTQSAMACFSCQDGCDLYILTMPALRCRNHGSGESIKQFGNPSRRNAQPHEKELKIENSIKIYVARKSKNNPRTERLSPANSGIAIIINIRHIDRNYTILI